MKKGDIVEWALPLPSQTKKWAVDRGLGVVLATGAECNYATPGLISIQDKGATIIEVMWSNNDVWRHASDELTIVSARN